MYRKTIIQRSSVLCSFTCCVGEFVIWPSYAKLIQGYRKHIKSTVLHDIIHKWLILREMCERVYIYNIDHTYVYNYTYTHIINIYLYKYIYMYNTYKYMFLR